MSDKTMPDNQQITVENNFDAVALIKINNIIFTIR